MGIKQHRFIVQPALDLKVGDLIRLKDHPRSKRYLVKTIHLLPDNMQHYLFFYAAGEGCRQFCLTKFQPVYFDWQHHPDEKTTMKNDLL